MKGNIGHLEGASGLAGVIKTVLILERGIIPPNANFEKLNAKIDADGLGLHVCVMNSESKYLLLRSQEYTRLLHFTVHSTKVRVPN